MRQPLFVIIPVLVGLAAPAGAADLTLRRAMLSSAGVGYFEYEAEVEGAATLGLDLPLDQVDDVLKSLVVYDNAGSIGGIELPGRDATRSAFADVPLGPEALDSPLDYLNALRGVVVEVSGPRPMTGRLLHAERMREAAREPADTGVPRTRVTLLAADGLRQFVLEDADAVTVADPVLRGRIDRALEALRRDARSDVRHVTIRSDGAGRRTVRVGYVAVAPLWKASYRLVLPAGQEGAKARLQGWAVLENATGADWNGVELSLQYGNPVTFHQAIYRSYYVERPEVPVQILGRLLPDVDTRARMAKSADAAEAMPPPPPAPAPMMAGNALRSAAPAPMPAQMAAPTAQAQGAEGADNTLFTLPKPVMLAAGHSASVPILDREVPATRIALATPTAAHPNAAVLMTNDGATSLPAGVLTLYDPAAATAYAGDARLGGLPAGEERLLPFAEDLRTTLDWRSDRGSRVSAVTAAGGVLTVENRIRDTVRVAVTAPAREARIVLLQIPTRNGQKLEVESGAEPAGVIAGATRLRVRLAAGETRTVTAYADTVQQQRVALLQDAPVLAQLIADQGVPEAARAALRKLADLRAAEAARVAERDRLKADLAAVEHDEERVRQNIAALPANEALRTRLIRQLDANETRIADLTKSIAQATEAVAAAHAALEQAVRTLQL